MARNRIRFVQSFEESVKCLNIWKWASTYREHGDLVAVSSFLMKGKEAKRDLHFNVCKYQDMTRIRPVAEQLAGMTEGWVQSHA
jgi:hypothetical protein